MTREQIAQRGQHIYDEQLKAHLEATHSGEFVAIEPESGAHAVAATAIAAANAIRLKLPRAVVHLVRIGSKTAYHLGAAACMKSGQS